MKKEEIKEWIEDSLDNDAHLMSPRFIRKLQEQKNTIIEMIKKNTAGNKYRDGETAFDIVQDINKLL